LKTKPLDHATPRRETGFSTLLLPAYRFSMDLYGREALGGAEVVVVFSFACRLQANDLPVSAIPHARGEAYGMVVN